MGERKKYGREFKVEAVKLLETSEIGKLSLNPGSCGVSVKAVTVSGAFVCNLQSITLKK